MVSSFGKTRSLARDIRRAPVSARVQPEVEAGALRECSWIGAQAKSCDPIQVRNNDHHIAERSSKAGSENTHTRAPCGKSASILLPPERL